MDTLSWPGIARLLALACCLASPAAWCEQLAYDEPLGCKGDRFVVSYCRGDSDTGPYLTNPLDNYCKVTYIDRPRVNGFLPETAELRGDILKKLVACGGGGAPALAPAAAPAAPKAPAGAKPQAADTNVVVPGTGNSKVTLLRLSHTKKGTRVVHYVDELSRKPTASPDVIAIWALFVYPDGEPSSPGTRAEWIEFHMQCANGSFAAVTLAKLDAEARLLGAKQLSGKQQQVPKGSVGESIFGIACKTAALSGSRFASTMAGIEDAMRPASAAAAVAASPAPAAAPTKPKDIEARADALLESWTAAYVDQDYDAALAHLHEYSKLYPQDANGYVWAGQTYTAKGDSAGAERAYLQAQRLAPQDASVNLAVGKLFLEVHEDKVRARTELLKVLALKSASLQDLVVAGELLKQAEDDKNATEAFRRAVQMSGDPELLARAWAGFGGAQKDAGRYTQALAALNEAIRLNPKNVDAHASLASVYYKQGDRARELTERQTVVRLTPEDPWAQWLLGTTHAALKQRAPALAAYDKAADLVILDGHMNDLDVLGSVADEYEELGEWARAAAVYRVMLAAQPATNDPEAGFAKAMDDTITCDDLGRALVQQKKYPEVVRLYVARGACSEFVVEAHLGVAYAWLGQPAKAIENLESATAATADNITYYERELASGKLDPDKREVPRILLAKYRIGYAQQLHALGHAYVLAGRKPDAQRTAKTLERYDAKLASKLTAEIGEKP